MIGRRALIAGAAFAGVVPAFAKSRGEIWKFDSLSRIGGLVPQVEGAPKLIDSPLGKAVLFDGVRDRLLIPRHPLAGTPRFTFEALFRPDGGAFEQRWFHLESGDGANSTARDGQRMLFEIRTEGSEWWLDTFLLGPGYRAPLIDATKRWPVGRWHHVAQSYDGRVYRAFVNGVEQARAELAFVPQAAGVASVGMRMNAVNPFNGAVRAAAFTRGAALGPRRYVLKIPR
ncbi:MULTISPECIES: LamG domain-containing protein [unclassified Sphingomonas]|uniref:LamG domain-containing protein n=1 Tax=unclassified Sphingomonas TaxID=196159 RepID=UPI002150C3CF|nr:MULTISPECIES: LamG domain-containing protein [unclassified Sphingomonas]MCR5870250.1 LamG domain-containing protein [Sphingomonas sp. J344]UUX98061.1 LamG domain-containing protein [Sphingomonas sp. J315]